MQGNIDFDILQINEDDYDEASLNNGHELVVGEHLIDKFVNHVEQKAEAKAS